MHFSTVLPDCISGWAVWGAKCNEVNSREDSLTLIFTGNPPSLPPRCTPDAPTNVLNPVKEVFSQHQENGPRFWGDSFMDLKTDLRYPIPYFPFTWLQVQFYALTTKAGVQSMSIYKTSGTMLGINNRQSGIALFSRHSFRCRQVYLRNQSR